MALAYERNRPEKTILHEVVTRTWPRIVSDFAAADQIVPYHVVQEMENYLKMRNAGIWIYSFGML